jgi:hypothetical protein
LANAAAETNRLPVAQNVEIFKVGGPLFFNGFCFLELGSNLPVEV